MTYKVAYFKFGLNNRIKKMKGLRPVLERSQSFVETLKTRVNVMIDNAKKHPESHQGHNPYLVLHYRVSHAP